MSAAAANLKPKTPDAPVAALVAKKTMRVLDTTALPGTTRVHQQVIEGTVKDFTFHPGLGLEMEPEVAAKFLRHEAFKLVDEKNNILAYVRPPRQPDELQAGEKLALGKDETVARYDELTNAALLRRALPMPGGERFAKNPERTAIIAFIVEAKRKQETAKLSKKKDKAFDVVDADSGDAGDDEDAEFNPDADTV